MAALRLVPASGSPIEITQDQVLIGREPSCDVVLNDGSVSRKHARLEKRGQAWTVVDQGSANGTFVDSQRITETALRPGQELRFGAVSFRVEIEGEEAMGATILTEPPGATVVRPIPPAAPPPRPPVPAPPPPVRAAVPPTGSIPPTPILPRPPAAPPPRPPAPPRPAAPPSMPPAAAALPPPKKGKGPFFWIATGCCGCFLLAMAIVAVIAGAAFHMTGDAVAAVRSQLAELKAGNTEAAYQRLSDDYKARLPREEFEVLVSRHPALKDNADSTFWKRSVENDRGEVSGLLTSTSGTREMVTYRLVKEAGAWKISDIEFAEGRTSS